MDNDLSTKADSTKHKIVRALLCAAGQHEAWNRPDAWGYMNLQPVHMSIKSDRHEQVHCAVCKHCRTVYVRRMDE